MTTPRTNLDHSRLNPTAASRRRLLKALGLGAVATQLSLDWTKPAIRLGALPAHAQGTVDDGCTVTFAYSLVRDNPYFVTVGFLPDIAEEEVTSSSTENTVTWTLPSSDHLDVSLAWTYVTNSAPSLQISMEASCCTAAATSSFELNSNYPTTGSSFLFDIQTADVGECSVNLTCDRQDEHG